MEIHLHHLARSLLRLPRVLCTCSKCPPFLSTQSLARNSRKQRLFMLFLEIPTHDFPTQKDVAKLELPNFTFQIFLPSLLACHSNAYLQRNGNDDVIHSCAEWLRRGMTLPGMYRLACDNEMTQCHFSCARAVLLHLSLIAIGSVTAKHGSKKYSVSNPGSTYVICDPI